MPPETINNFTKIKLTHALHNSKPTSCYTNQKVTKVNPKLCVKWFHQQLTLTWQLTLLHIVHRQLISILLLLYAFRGGFLWDAVAFTPNHALTLNTAAQNMSKSSSALKLHIMVWCHSRHMAFKRGFRYQLSALLSESKWQKSKSKEWRQLSAWRKW